MLDYTRGEGEGRLRIDLQMKIRVNPRKWASRINTIGN